MTNDLLNATNFGEENAIYAGPIETPGINPEEKPEVEPEKLPGEDPGIQPGKHPGKQDDEDEEEDDEDSPFTDNEIGDDPGEIRKKTTVM